MYGSTANRRAHFRLHLHTWALQSVRGAIPVPLQLRAALRAALHGRDPGQGSGTGVERGLRNEAWLRNEALLRGTEILAAEKLACFNEKSSEQWLALRSLGNTFGKESQAGRMHSHTWTWGIPSQGSMYPGTATAGSYSLGASEVSPGLLATGWLPKQQGASCVTCSDEPLSKNTPAINLTDVPALQCGAFFFFFSRQSVLETIRQRMHTACT